MGSDAGELKQWHALLRMQGGVSHKKQDCISGTLWGLSDVYRYADALSTLVSKYVKPWFCLFRRAAAWRHAAVTVT